MPRTVKLALLSAVAVIALLAFAAVAGAKLTADYRFGNDLESHGGGAPKLVEVATGGAFATDTIGGSNDRVWVFPAGDGLRLRKAAKVMGAQGRTYTFVMLVNLDLVNNYRKLVDFDNLNSDEGWYVYEESLYPYDVSGVDYDKQRLEAGKWSQIALTRNGRGRVTGYVGNAKIDDARDKHKDIALGPDKFLHFLMDDGGAEQTSGSIARLRVWDTALSAKAIRHLRH